MLTKRTARFFRDRAARLGVSLFDATCGCGCAPPTQGASATRTPVLDSRPRRFRSVVSSPTGGDSMKRIAVAAVAVALCATAARRQAPDGGFQFRIGIEALVGKGLALSNPDPNKLGVLPWVYLSIGYSL